MKFYDPIIAITQENISLKTKELYKAKNSVAYSIITKNDFLIILMDYLGFFKSSDKLSFKY
jgi:hypothetical protein